MNKVILFAILAIVLTSTLTLAISMPKATRIQEDAFKAMLKNYLSPVLHGYGIGFTSDTYVTAKWHMTDVKILSREQIRNTLQQALAENITDWGTIKERLRTQLEASGTSVKKGLIKIDGTQYLLTNIQTTDTSASADIREMPNWENCKSQNITAEACGDSGAKVGDISVTKKTKANQEIANEPRVWGGTLNFNSVAYTFVTFAYPR